MKHHSIYIAFLSLLLMTVVQGAMAQDALFDKYEDTNGVTTVFISKTMLSMIPNVKTGNHDISKIPLARSRRNNGNSTMQFSVDPFGLNLDWVKLDTENNSEARALYSAVQRGDISGMSFMFSVDSDEWENLESEHPTRHIKKIGSVVEVSAVTFPAYDATEIYARSKEALDSARSAMEIARQQRAKSVDTDELALLKEKTKLISKGV